MTAIRTWDPPPSTDRLIPRSRRVLSDLTRLASYHPEAIGERGVEFLVLDECHERSIEADLLALMARRLLGRYPRLKIVLMSATMMVELYEDYFAKAVGPEQVSAPLHVGEQRYPVAVSFLDEVADMPGLPDRLRRAARKLGERCDAIGGSQMDESSDSVPATVVSAQLELAAWVARLAAKQATDASGGGERGGAVLIFVAGLSDIEELAEELQASPGFTFIPVHGELELDEQARAFEPAPPGTTKIVAATNAAESSITLPDVDVVIDLGVCKSARWVVDRGCACLMRTWVSRASATQRSGRTGRVRPGKCYRLFSRGLFDALPAHEPGQMGQQPLESTVLHLRSMLAAEQRVSTLLNDCLEPPDASNLSRALLALHQQGFLRVDSRAAAELPPGALPEDAIDELDRAPLTQIGALAAALPLDLQLSRLVAYGVQFDCAAEAIALAAALALPKPAFRAISPLTWPDVEQYNAMVRLVSEGRRTLDQGLQSEPLSMLTLLALLQERQVAAATGRRRGGGGATASAAVGGPGRGSEEESGEATIEGMAEAEEDGEEEEADAQQAKGFVCMRRSDMRWAQALGLSPRVCRQFVQSVATLQRHVAKALKLPAHTLAPPKVFPPPGRDGSFALARLRALLVWSFPNVLLRATPPKAKRGGGGGGGGSAGGSVGGPEARTVILSGASLSREQLASLLPPPLAWRVSSTRCDVVQVAQHARISHAFSSCAYRALTVH